MPRSPRPPLTWEDLLARCERTGLLVRGGFHPTPGDVLAAPLPDVDGAPPATVVLLGNAGPAMWEAFHRARAERPELDGIDAWTRAVVTPLAAELGARPLFPFEGPPYWPFQQWARRAEPVFTSPLGLLIHATFGLWHAYRAALLFPEPLPAPPRPDLPSPCATCPDRPCLRACPAGAFSEAGYDVPACMTHLRRTPEPECITASCLARRACPVGQQYVYTAPQREHHMRAFLRQWPGAPGDRR